jgi:hypothetical protein
LPLWSQRSDRSSDVENNSLLPENWETRAYFETQIFSPLSRLSPSRRRRYNQIEDSRTVSFRIETRDKSAFLLFVGEDETGRFSLLNRGNISIRRDRQDGGFKYMTVLLRDRADCYARMYPVDEKDPLESKTGLEVVLFGIPIYRDVNLPLKFRSVLTLPFSRIMHYTRDRVKWARILTRGTTLPVITHMVEKIRDELPDLTDLEDGAYNKKGEAVFIQSEERSPGGMNCSGFAKWIVDGFYYPIKKEYIDIKKLKERLLKARGNRWSEKYELERDPYFGLDWSRNLALALEQATNNGNTGSSTRTSADKDAGSQNQMTAADAEAFDVVSVDYHDYVEDVGYPLESLELLMFLLALDSPDSFFLGSINVEYGSEPSLRQHTHLVVLVPTFSPRGSFETLVFEINRETGVKSLINRYKDGYIHLVRIKATESFQPQSF